MGYGHDRRGIPIHSASVYRSARYFHESGGPASTNSPDSSGTRADRASVPRGAASIRPRARPRTAGHPREDGSNGPNPTWNRPRTTDVGPSRTGAPGHLHG